MNRHAYLLNLLIGTVNLHSRKFAKIYIPTSSIWNVSDPKNFFWLILPDLGDHISTVWHCVLVYSRHSIHVCWPKRKSPGVTEDSSFFWAQLTAVVFFAAITTPNILPCKVFSGKNTSNFLREPQNPWLAAASLRPSHLESMTSQEGSLSFLLSETLYRVEKDRRK